MDQQPLLHLGEEAPTDGHALAGAGLDGDRGGIRPDQFVDLLQVDQELLVAAGQKVRLGLQGRQGELMRNSPLAVTT